MSTENRLLENGSGRNQRPKPCGRRLMTSVYPSRMLNAAYLGEYADRNSAMLRVENDIQHQMEMVLHDWKLYRAAKGGDLAGRKGVCIEVRQGG